MSVQDLRDVLREHGDGPSPSNPARHDQVRTRIRRRRLRRRALAGGVGVIAAASLLLGIPELRHETTVTTTAAPGLAARFTAPDGTEYRRVALVTIKKRDATKVTVEVPLTGKPLEVASPCEGIDSRLPIVHSGTGRAARDLVMAGCPSGLRLEPLPLPNPLPRDAKSIPVTFDTTGRGGCVWRTGECVRPKDSRGVWTMAVYEWTPPTRPVEPPPIEALKALPDQMGKAVLVERKTGIWPLHGSVTFEVRGKIDFNALCSGDLAKRLSFTVAQKDSKVSTKVTCLPPGAYPAMMVPFTFPSDRTTKVKLTGQFVGDSTNRPVRWAISVYQR